MNTNMYAEEAKEDLLLSLRKLADKLYYEKGNYFEECDNFLLELEQTISSCEHDELKKIFDYGYGFGPFDEKENNKVPFYVYMDIIAETLSQQSKYSDEKDRVVDLATKFRKYKDITKEFSGDKRFDPDKHLDGEFVKNIMSSKGLISLFENKDYPNLLMIHFGSRYEMVRTKRDSHYDLLGEYRYKNNTFFYKEDEAEYKRLLREKYDELKEMYSQVFEKYLVDGQLPDYRSIEEKLIDKDTNDSIKDALKQISLSRGDYDMTPVGELEWMKANLVSVKFILRQDVLEKENEENDLEEDKKIKVVGVQENPVVVKRSKREILKEMFGLVKEFIGVTNTNDDVKKKK